jgi:predicted DNA-binding transcriptional regulator AlpA
MTSFRHFIFLTESTLSTEHEVMNLYYDRNHKIADISDLTGVSAAGIYRILQKHSIQPGRMKTDLLNYETIWQYSSMGLPAKKIAELTGYSVRQVYNIIEKKIDSVHHSSS